MRKLLILLILTSVALAEFDKVATTAAPFLKLGVGSRATALGGAFVARADDGFATYWNPAGMLAAREPTAAFSLNDWALDIQHQYASIIIPTDIHGRLGLSVSALTMGEQEVTTVDEPNGTGLYYNAMDLALGLSYARQVSDRFRLGMTVKYIQLSAYNETAQTMALDMGTLLRTDFYGLTIGMSLSNFGGELRYEGRDLITRAGLDQGVDGSYDADATLTTESWPLPLLIRIGVAIDLMGPENAVIPNQFSRLTLTLDGDHPNDGPEHVNLGAEFALKEMIYLRGGYRHNYDEERFTMGVGLRLDLGLLGETQLDYALKPLGPFGTTSILSIEFRR